MSIKFSVDEVIEKNSILVADLMLSVLFLKNDKENPWFILVPKRAGVVELMDLNHEDQSVLMEEVTIVSEFLKKEFNAEKLNVGSLGNIVKQLHIHVIARYEKDRAWPGPIWGTQTTQEFSNEEIKNIISGFKDFNI